MSKALKKDATYADLCAVPEDFVAEILGGELYATPRPAFRHVRAASALGILLGGPYQFGVNGPGGWLILDEPELHLRKDVVVPDIAGWRREQMTEDSDPAFLAVAPNWLCEVLSPATEMIDRGKKLKIYAREGVGYVWLLSPIARTLEVWRLDDADWTLVATHAGGERVLAEPFDAVELALDDLWPR
jgi:Uma2 family endonuclease